MTPEDVDNLILDPMFDMLPSEMDTIEARAMLLAIGLQESQFRHRHQVGGPAHSFWQFETAGVRGVLKHHSTADLAAGIGELLTYNVDVDQIHDAMQNNDLLAAAMARLLLWTLPDKLPVREEQEAAWVQYLKAWRPGRPHPQSWRRNWEAAWEALA